MVIFLLNLMYLSNSYLCYMYFQSRESQLEENVPSSIEWAGTLN